MKFKFYLSSLVFLLASFMMVNAQTKTVKGKITDGVDALYGVNVVLQGTTTGVISDDDGNFAISSDQDFPWTLEINKDDEVFANEFCITDIVRIPGAMKKV